MLLILVWPLKKKQMQSFLSNDLINEIQKKTLDSQSSSIFKIIDKDNISKL